MYYLNIYTDCPKSWLLKYDLKEKYYKDSLYYQLKGEYKELESIRKRLIRCKIRHKMFEERYQKSNDYRKIFLENTSGPYRCRYCNRPLKTEYMQVDHIIPASKVKSNAYLQMWLFLNKCESVNDLKNLVPSCFKCNQAKGRKIGLWPLRAYLGQFESYWKIKKGVDIGLLVTGIGLIAFLGAYYHEEIISVIQGLIR